MTVNIFDSEYTFRNKSLEMAYEISKSLGLRVYTHRKIDKCICHLYVANEYTYGSISSSYGGLSYSTCHKPSQNIGSGFSLTGKAVECLPASIELILKTLCFAPSWVFKSDLVYVQKQTWEQYIKSEKILTYTEL